MVVDRHRVCRGCGNSFLARAKNVWFCKPECRRVRTFAVETSCEACGTFFLKTRKDKRVCGTLECLQKLQKSRSERYYMKLYGLTLEELQKMRCRQGNRCAICHQPETTLTRTGSIRNLAIDHDHSSGTVRGLLCGDCNRAIGLFADNPMTCIAAAQYLSPHSEQIEEHW